MEYINEKDMKYLEEDVENLILSWLKDEEVVESITSFQEESKKVAKIIAEMIPRWNNFSEEYRAETEEYDNSDYEYEVRAGK
jgi:chloramphenicol O-acetyltransferase